MFNNELRESEDSLSHKRFVKSLAKVMHLISVFYYNAFYILILFDSGNRVSKLKKWAREGLSLNLIKPLTAR